MLLDVNVMNTCFDIMTGFVFNLYLFDSVLVICHFNIFLTEADVMHDARYVYSIWHT